MIPDAMPKVPRRLKNVIVAAIVLALSGATVAPAIAHPVNELEYLLGERENYFQPLDNDTPDFELQDADGREARLADFHDKVVVVHFVYTSCPDVCPLHAERIAEIQTMVNQTPMKDRVQFISVTTDPKIDTADVMREYGPAHGLDAVNWTMLSSGPGKPEDTTRKLAEQFGHKFTKTDDGYQLHGVVTHVIDREGRWRANFHGLEFQPTNLVVFIDALVNDTDKPHGHGERSFWEMVRELF